MLGVGFDAHVVKHVSFSMKKLSGKGAYVLRSMAELTRYGFPPIRCGWMRWKLRRRA